LRQASLAIVEPGDNCRSGLPIGRVTGGIFREVRNFTTRKISLRLGCQSAFWDQGDCSGLIPIAKATFVRKQLGKKATVVRRVVREGLNMRAFAHRIFRFDWRRRDNQDGLMLIGLGMVIFAAAHFYDLPPYLLQFGLDHADWEIDDLIFVLFMLSVGLMVFGFRRYRDLAREIRARTDAELQAHNLARHDSLTGLPNRRYFAEKLGQCVLAVDATHRIAVLMLDLDGFKRINDAHGHATGDKALREFALRVAAVVPANAFFARIGGDEFAIVMPDIGARDEPANLARRIGGTVGEPFDVDGRMADFGVGIGIAIAPDDGSNPDELVRRADRALHRAKAAGRSAVRFFEPEMDAHVDRRIEIERELRNAVAADLLVPHYQPLVCLENDRIIGFEALARWKNEVLGPIPPDVFIPIAEETGLINELGDQLLRRACLDATAWPAHFVLAFNVSPLQLHDPTLGLRILSILGQTGLNPRRLEIEITESALVQNIGVAQAVLGQLRQAGVRIALDDFGTGYATFSQLLSFRLDKIKIDRSFVSRLDEGGDSGLIVNAILGLAKGFGFTTTAEGVEGASQTAYLKAHGCTEGQGYLFSKAVPAADIPALLDREHRLASAVA
jgi:diguanylate cyclase (GGDEF)-like protein